MINWHGDRQTFGTKGYLLLGHHEQAEYIHIVEGWATAYAIARIRSARFAAVVCFGKSRMADAAEFAINQWKGTVVQHDEISNVDCWDIWDRGEGEKYMKKMGIK